jgi:hypothetical protein
MKELSLPTFSSEALLQQAIAGLFAKMPNVTDVQILQGIKESGKDIVFFSSGPIGERMSCACVVKNKKITGRVDRNSGARTVLFQAQQCLDTPYPNGFGEFIRIDRVYVITPYPIGLQVIQSIIGQLAGHSQQIVFLDGAKLFELFEKYWPDFFADEASAIERYLEHACSEIESESEITRLDGLYDLEPPPEKKVYVPLTFFREFSQYTLYPPLLSYLPTEKDFRSGKWKRRDHEELERKYETVRHFVHHIAEWGFWKSKRTSNLRTFLPPAFEIVNMYIEKWLKSAKKLGRKGEIPKLDEGAQLQLEDVEEFISRQREISRTLENQNKRFTDQVHSLNEAVELLKKEPAKSPLHRFPYEGNLDLARLDVCLRHAPRIFVAIGEKVTLTFPSNLPSQLSNSLLVVGPAGSGKTSFCRWNALRDAASHARGTDPCIPIYVPLHRLKLESVNSLQDIMKWAAGGTALLADIDKKRLLSSEKPVRLYLDGLDEVATEAGKKVIMELVRLALTEIPNLQVIMTSRDYIASPWTDLLSRVHLAGLRDEQLLEMASQWLGSPEKADNFNSQLKKMPALNEIVNNPLLATLTILVFRQTGTLPDSRTRLYKMFVELLCGGWDLIKGVLRASRFTRDAKNRVLTHLAMLAHKQEQKAFEPDLLSMAVSRVFPRDHKIDLDDLERELRADGLICVEGSQLKFVHLSFQEYLSATYIIGQPHTRELKRAVKLFDSGEDWWRDVIRFYIGLTHDPVGFSKWLSTMILNRYDELREMTDEEARGLNLSLARPIAT